MSDNIAGDELRAIIERLDAPTFAQMIEVMEESECWRQIPGHPGYAVSSWGRVRGKRTGILKTTKNKGYHRVSLSSGSEVKSVFVSRLVLEAFVGPAPFDDAQAAHGDGDTDNNRLSNLRWSTAFENQADVDRHGNRCKGSAVFGAVLTEADIPVIRQRAASGERYPTIAADYGVSIHTISLIKLGKTWAHV